MLALAASFCTATSSVCQRLGAQRLERNGLQVRDFDIWLVFRLATQPIWMLGFAAMIAAFVLQVSALRFGPLALVQPILAGELVFVFGYLAVARGPRSGGWRGVGSRDWLAAAAMAAGIGVFLRAASPSGGQQHAPAGSWWLAGVATLGCVLVSVLLAGSATKAGRRSSTWRAAWLGVAAGVAWGYVGAVIKELSSHVDGGLGAIFATWSVYVLMAAGAAAMLLTSHAMAAGPLAASQPGFTIFGPVAAILLGVLMFGEHMRAIPSALAAEALGLIVAASGAWALSRSDLITHPSP